MNPPEPVGVHIFTDDDRVRQAGESLRRCGVRVLAGHSVANVPDDVGLLVYSTAVKADNPERMRAVQDNPALAFVAHPSMAGATRIAPPLLIGKLFRVLGADGVVFPNYGGRFGYSPDTCRDLTREAREERQGMRPALPVPAGGIYMQEQNRLMFRAVPVNGWKVVPSRIV